MVELKIELRFCINILTKLTKMENSLNVTNMQKLIKEITNMLPKESQTKIGNIEKASVEGPLSTKRVSQGSRTSVPYTCQDFDVDILKSLHV